MPINFARIAKSSEKIAIGSIMLCLYGSMSSFFLVGGAGLYVIYIWAINFVPLIVTATPATGDTYIAHARHMGAFFDVMCWPFLGFTAFGLVTLGVALVSGAVALAAARVACFR